MTDLVVPGLVNTHAHTAAAKTTIVTRPSVVSPSPVSPSASIAPGKSSALQRRIASLESAARTQAVAPATTPLASPAPVEPLAPEPVPTAPIDGAPVARDDILR